MASRAKKYNSKKSEMYTNAKTYYPKKNDEKEMSPFKFAKSRFEEPHSISLDEMLTDQAISCIPVIQSGTAQEIKIQVSLKKL